MIGIDRIHARVPILLAVAAASAVAVAAAVSGTVSRATTSSPELVPSIAPEPPGVVWTCQFGSDSTDATSALAVAADGSAFLVGGVGGPLPGEASDEGWHAFLRAYAPDGTVRWTRRGSDVGDSASAVATDGRQVIVGGVTRAPAGAPESERDGYLRAFGTDGTTRWVSPLETTAWVGGIAVTPGGGVLVVGRTEGVLAGETSAGRSDAYVRAYTADGELRWARQFGSSRDDDAVAVAVDASGTVYVAGNVVAGRRVDRAASPGDVAGSPVPLGDPDAPGSYVTALASDGTERWTQRFGLLGEDEVRGLAVDEAGNAYVAGVTHGVLGAGPSAGSFDAFLRSYAPDGRLRWSRQFGTPAGDAAEAVAVSGAAGILVAGWTQGHLAGQGTPGAGPADTTQDAFLRAYTPEGTELWTEQFGTDASDHADAVAGDGGRGIWVAGTTSGFLGPGAVGRSDAFLRAYRAGAANAPAASCTEAGAMRWAGAASEQQASVLEGMGLWGRTR